MLKRRGALTLADRSNMRSALHGAWHRTWLAAPCPGALTLTDRSNMRSALHGAWHRTWLAAARP